MSYNSSGKSDKNYDRSVCFTMYRNWVETGYVIEEAYGIEASLTWRKLIENYCLYGNAPEWESLPEEYTLPLKLAWNGIQGNVDAELAKRKKYFKEEELNEQQKAVIQYKVEHPESSGRACAKALGMNPSTVNNWLRNESINALIQQKQEEQVCDKQDQPEQERHEEPQYQIVEQQETERVIEYEEEEVPW